MQLNTASDEHLSQLPVAANSETPENLFALADSQLERAFKVVNIDESVRTILGQPKNEIIIHFPVRLSSGETKLFKGYRVQHNNLLGPFKGGIRFHQDVYLDE
jgi:glutamate dehydrogenase (NAD(P)+)